VSNRIKSALGVFAIWLSGCANVSSVAGATEPIQFRIDAIGAMPYYVDQGVIRTSTDLFDKRLVLRNVVTLPNPSGDPLRRSHIGDWDVLFGTTATYVVVTVTNLDPDELPKRVRLTFVATAKESNRALVAQDLLLSTLMIRGLAKAHIPIFVYGTGCESLELKAQIRNVKKVVSELVRTIPFTCGE
jgi:hypothetical protein